MNEDLILQCRKQATINVVLKLEKDYLEKGEYENLKRLIPIRDALLNTIEGVAMN